MKIKFKKIHSKAKTPTQATPGSACYDLYACEITYKHMWNHIQYLEYDTGIVVEIPENHVGLLYSRSSVSKRGMSLCNGVGVIDSDFRNSIRARFYPNITGFKSYEVGDRVAQLMIIPYPQIELVEVDELSNTERGEGGFGSTGDK